MILNILSNVYIMIYMKYLHVKYNKTKILEIRFIREKKKVNESMIINI